MAHAAGVESHQHLSGLRRGEVELLHLQRSADALEHGPSGLPAARGRGCGGPAARVFMRRAGAEAAVGVRCGGLSHLAVWMSKAKRYPRGPMRAIVFTGAGGAEVMRLEERPDPVPGKGKVLVEQRFAGINPADLMQRAGNY